ncbi:MAG TPA: AAA family ATPase, partial [Polyangiales bacterium]
RLTAIGNLPAEDERHIAQAFLISPKLVGRKVESERLRKRLERALNRRGNAVSIVSAAGIGRSRMLSSIILEGKLLGAITLAVDATAVGSGPLALVGALAEQLLELQPLAAESHAELAPLLGHLSPALRTALGKPALAEVSGASRTRKLTRALVSLFEVASRERRLVIAVDDVHRADNASLGVLAELSLLARERRMFLVTSCEVGTLANPPPALAQLVQARERIDLSPLTAADTRELLVSLFGEIHGLEDAASWLHELSQGSPQTCMHYAQYLVDQGVARYEGGHWHLDGQLRDRGLPTSLGAMFESRIAALSEDAKTIALGLVLSRDETRSSWQPELHLRFEDFAKLLDRPEPALAFAAIDELVRAGIVQQRDRYYVLGQRAIVDALLRITDPESRRRLHIRLADILGQSGYPMQILPVVQLQHAGEHARARRALTEFYRSEVSGTFDWSVMRVSVSAGCSELALAHWRLDRDGPIDAIALRKVLTLIASVYDWRLARYGDAQLDQLRHDSGLIHWDETDASQAPIQRVFECMKCAQQTYEQTPESMRGLVPASAIREIAACAMPLASAYVHSHDIERAQALPPLLAPLRALSPLIDLLAHIIDIGVARLSGKEIGDSLLVSIEKLMAATDLPQVLREGGAGVNLHAQAVEDARCGRPRALVLLERLVPGVGENMFLVFHARWLAHAFAGRAVEARRFHKQVEMITEDDVWRRNASLFVEAELHALTGDLLNLKRSRDSLAALAKTFPGIEPWAAFAQGALLRLRGESESALAEFARALASAKPGEHRAYLQAAPAHAEQRLERGQLAMALEEAIALVATVDRLGLCRSAAISGERIRALAESALGDHEAAEGSLARAFAIASEYSYGGLPLAKLYQASTQLALAAGDAGRALEALRGMWALIEHADAPAFINRYQALREESSRHLDVLDLPAQIESVRSMLTESATSWNDLNTRLSATGTPRSRAQQALSVLLDE